MTDQQSTTRRSLFWPILLIGAGIIWLLNNLGILSISWDNLAILFQLWPILLIFLGIDLLFGRRFPVLRGVFGVLAALLVLVLVLVGPSMGLVKVSNLTLKTESFSEPLNAARSARVELDLPLGVIDLHALRDSANLLEADITHAGEVALLTHGERDRVVQLKTEHPRLIFDMFNLIETSQEQRSEIRLNGGVPLDLEIQLDVGNATLDLSRLQLTELDVDGDVGQVALTLPATESRYEARIKGDVGSFQVSIPEAADIDLEIEGDVGGFTVDVPPDAGVRVEARVEIGDVDVPTTFSQLEWKKDDLVGEQGVWESENYEDADRKIVILFQGDIGGLDIQ